MKGEPRGVTFLFAWYSATMSGDVSASGKSAISIAGSKDTYNVGDNVTVSAAFSARNEEYTATQGNMPTWSNSGSEGFGHVHLTNDAGAIVPITVAEKTDGGFSLGTANVVITLSSRDAATLAAAFEAMATAKNTADETSYTFDYFEYTYTLGKEGRAKVLAIGTSKPSKSGSNYAHADKDFVLRITSAGVFTLKYGETDLASSYGSNESDGYKWTIPFYYGEAPVHTSGEVGNADFVPDQATDHDTEDQIKVTASDIAWHH